MKINEFKLERYFAQHEFSAKYLLSSSDCDGFALKDVLNFASKDEIELWENLTLGYTESEGSSLLRDSISKYYKNISKKNILVASPGELNYIAMNVLLDPGDHVITVSPSYQSLYEVVRSIGCDISYWTPDAINWKFDPEKLESLVRKNTKLIVINFPHNPTGAYLTQIELNKIIDIARENNIYIFSDEMYHKLITGNLSELSPVSDIYEKGISLWGTSKSFGLAGLRTGWLVSQDLNLLKKIQSFKDYLSICNSAPSEILTLIAVKNSEKFLKPNIEKIKKNIIHFTEFAKDHYNIFEFIPPKAGSTAFVKLKINKSSLEFSNKLVEETGIMTLPAEMFEYKGNYIRIGFGRKNFPDTLSVLNRFLRH